ncbi:Uncharacterised protein [Chlamydia trachomatis]|nr:Uncharacterised protein [Chlamydia trachomatis]CRH47360.1 Uncharacterised protein [Chlamydia trachomatis]CRH47713.1 Uncharacterised protein [Chlamydia trachomatis]CRH65514.1 Uncharacterised protein [Chlamydia trachomatis]CRH87970.1 Uncharacterised protein [Chlamydia trachomatis]
MESRLSVVVIDPRPPHSAQAPRGVLKLKWLLVSPKVLQRGCSANN